MSVNIHDPSELVDPFVDSFKLHPSHRYEVKFFLLGVAAHKSLNDISFQHRHCKMPSEVKDLKAMKSYTQQNCKLEHGMRETSAML